MNRKIQNIFQPSLRLYMVILILFAAAALLVDKRLAAAEGAVILALAIYTLIRVRGQRKQVEHYLESVTYDADTAANNTLINFPMPMTVFRMADEGVIWGNEEFWRLCGKENKLIDQKLGELLPGLSLRWLRDGETKMTELFTMDGRQYAVQGNLVRSQERSASSLMGVVYLLDMTETEAMRQEYNATRPVVMVIVVDNYDELLKPLSDRQKIELRGRLDDAVGKWCEGHGGIVRRFDRDRYLFFCERRELDAFREERFSLLEDIRQVESAGGILATAAIGVGMDGSGLEETFSYATLAAEMALSRGGDQAVIKNRFNFEFFGGRGAEVEKRNKVRSRVMANSLSRLISDASRVYVMGHRYADLDTIGAAAGVCCIARKLGTEAHIVLGDGPHASARLLDRLLALPEYENALVSPQEAMLKADRDTLLIVVDTNRPEQVEDRSLLESCNQLAVIDHHRRAATYIENPTMSLYEPNASSACELVAEMMEELLSLEDVTEGDADAVLSGVVLDTKNFTLRAGERTFDAAAFLRRCGADPSRVKLLLQSGMEETLARYEILRCTRIYRGIAVAVPKEPQDRVVASQAADELLNVHDVTASVVMYPTVRGGVDVSARSIGSVNVQVLLEALGGGGNMSAAGAQMQDVTLEEAEAQLLAAIDRYLETDE